MDNLVLAERKARQGKAKSYGVRLFDRAKGCNLIHLHNDLAAGSYRTPEYSVFKIYEPKKREIYRLPYRDRIVHHAIMNIVEPIWVSVFTKDTYSCIKGRGIHQAAAHMKIALRNDPEGTQYCLKIDVRKFYPSINHEILKGIIRKRIKCKLLLKLLDEIIDSAPGVPIGNYLSQYFANLYLAYFDHKVKECLGVKYYFRYADDMVVLAGNKEELHRILAAFHKELSELDLDIKSNYQIFPVDARGIDFVGYRFFHTHTLLRKSIKKRFARSVSRGSTEGTAQWWAYWGWAKHCDSKHLIKKLKNNEVKQNSHAAA